MTWLYYTFSAVILFTTISLLQKIVANETQFHRAAVFIFNCFATLITIGIFLATQPISSFHLPTAPAAWGFLFLGGAFYGLFERGRYYVAQLLDASVLSTILTLSTLVAFIGASFLYQEAITLNKLAGAMLILTSLVLISYKSDKGKAKTISRKGLIAGILVSIALGLGWMLDKMGAIYFGTNIYSVLIWAAGLPIIFLPSIKFSELKIEFSRSWKNLALLAGFNATGYLFQIKALAMTEATRVIPIVQTATLFTAVMGILILKERDNIFRKIMAALLALAGTYFLV